jgi:hypothetical protein
MLGNSGVFLRFRYPHTKWEDINQQEPRARNNPAWVAAATGFEVQIDEQGKKVTTFKKPAGKYQDRGLTPTADNSSGYVGLQAHTEKVAFRHIRIKPM